MEELISIIIPIYNVEEYLTECLESVVNQTYKNIEIILINDGSTDNSAEICNKYKEIDKRISVIHKENGGLSDARNHGLDLASGKYIVFIDSDDYIELKYIEKLYYAIKENETQISQCNVVKVNDKKEILEKYGYFEKQIKKGIDIIEDMYSKHVLENTVVWNKMYSIELFKQIRYPIGKIHEDEYTTYKILYNTDKIAIVNEYLYNYRQANNSITGRKFNKKRLDSIEAIEEKISFFQQKKEQKLYELTLKQYQFLLITQYINCKLYLEDSKSIQKEILKKYRRNYKNISKSKECSLLSKIRFLIGYISPMLYFYINEKLK